MRLEDSPSHNHLTSHATSLKKQHMRDLFECDAERFQRFSVQGPNIFLDYSKNLINERTVSLLVDAANQAQLGQHINDLFKGATVNKTEDRPALHTALRQTSETPIYVDGKDVLTDIKTTRQKISQFINTIHANEHFGYTGKPINTLVSIGIGGSYLGPKMVTEALTPYTVEGFKSHFIANIDASDLTETLKKIDPETTLFLIQSKSFTTLETRENSLEAKRWMEKSGLTGADISKHLVAVTANIEAAVEFGLDPDCIFPMWDWVGGRYSLWSAIGLPIAFQVGMANFELLLQGANDMDRHFQQSPFESNLPVLLALLGIWYNNYFDAASHAILPYDQYLRFLPSHLQQLDMESSGKSVDMEGQALSYQTGPIIWGGEGSNGQHAYHQLLHQGTRLIPADFIMPLKSHNPIGNHHKHLFSNCLSQSQALMQGKSFDEAYEELRSQGMAHEQAKSLAKHKAIAGNKPSNTLILDMLTPASVGSLIALYEHKVFVQGVLWNINSFDQWGVELGKTLGGRIFQAINQRDSELGMDSSTTGLIKRFKAV